MTRLAVVLLALAALVVLACRHDRCVPASLPRHLDPAICHRPCCRWTPCCPQDCDCPESAGA